MHCPVTSSQRRVPQSQAGRGRNGVVFGGAQGECKVTDAKLNCSVGSWAVFMQVKPLQGWKIQPFPKSASALRSKMASAGKAEQEMGQLTPAVGEAPVAGGTAGALSPDDVGLAGTLPAEGLALAAPRPGLVAPAGLRPVVVEEGE